MGRAMKIVEARIVGWLLMGQKSGLRWWLMIEIVPTGCLDVLGRRMVLDLMTLIVSLIGVQVVVEVTGIVAATGLAVLLPLNLILLVIAHCGCRAVGPVDLKIAHQVLTMVQRHSDRFGDCKRQEGNEDLREKQLAKK